MAKKSASARSSAHARRHVSLVREGQRAPSGDQTPEAATNVAEPSATQSAPPATPKADASAAPAPKPSAPATKATAAALNKAQARSIARAQTVQRNRVAGLISAENYTYVRHDLQLTLAVAGAMVLLMIILTQVLPHFTK